MLTTIHVVVSCTGKPTGVILETKSKLIPGFSQKLLGDTGTISMEINLAISKL